MLGTNTAGMLYSQAWSSHLDRVYGINKEQHGRENFMEVI